MSKIPTTQLCKAFKYLYENKHTITHYGKNKEWTLNIDYDNDMMIKTIVLSHYFSDIIKINFYPKFGYVSMELLDGYSASDRDNINGLFCLLGITERVCIRNWNIRFNGTDEKLVNHRYLEHNYHENGIRTDILRMV